MVKVAPADVPPKPKPPDAIPALKEMNLISFDFSEVFVKAFVAYSPPISGLTPRFILAFRHQPRKCLLLRRDWKNLLMSSSSLQVAGILSADVLGRSWSDISFRDISRCHRME